jgi:hypothetical protein
MYEYSKWVVAAKEGNAHRSRLILGRVSFLAEDRYSPNLLCQLVKPVPAGVHAPLSKLDDDQDGI